MRRDDPFHALVEPLREETVSGASQLAHRAANAVARAARGLDAGSAEEVRARLGDLGRMILDAQPAMAPLVALVREVLEATQQASSADAARERAVSAALAFAEASEGRLAGVSSRAQTVLPDGALVATISASGAVQAALLEARARGARALCFESRPMREGRGLAVALSEAGMQVTYAVDAAIHALAPSADVVAFGADSIGDLGAVNKIGSAVLAAAAHGAGVPVYVLADTTKILPVGYPQSLADDRPRSQVWHAPSAVRVWNRYFEAVPLDLVDGVVTEHAVMAASALARLRAGMSPEPELRAGRDGNAARPGG